MGRFFIIMILLSLPSILNGQIQIGQDIDGEAAGDICGRSVSMSSDGTLIALGCPWDPKQGARTGKVMVFEEISGVWTQLGQSLFGGSAGIWFGYDIALSGDGNRLAVGAYYHDNKKGQVKIYEYQTGSWVQLGSDLLGDAVGDRFGESVSLSEDGSRVVVGAPYNDLGGSDAGVTKIFEYTMGNWVQVGANIPGEAVADQSGVSVSISDDGSRIATGARANDGNGNASGHARLYEESGGSWVKIGNDLDGDAILDFFGTEVALSGDGSRVIIGSIADYAKVFEENGGTWNLVGNRINGTNTGDEFGRAVSISEDGSRIAVGAQFNDTNGNNSGQIKVFEEMGGTWVQIGADINGENPGDYFGHDFSVTLSADGQKVSGGGYLNNDNGTSAGHARVFEINVILVNISEFKGVQIGNTIALHWQSVTREEIQRFEVENSSDASSWQRIGWLPLPKNSEDFMYHHTNPSVGKNLYRIKIVDLDGNFTYSKIIESTFNPLSSRLAVFPNPSTGDFQLSFPNMISGKAFLTAFDLTGQKKLEIELDSNSNMQFSIPEPGYYVLSIQTTEGIFYKHIMVNPE